jgi:hypothetical protein
MKLAVCIPFGSSPKAESNSPGNWYACFSVAGSSLRIGDAKLTVSSFAPLCSRPFTGTRQRRNMLSASSICCPFSRTVA